ncbi:MAG: pectate lyase, partial [Chthoniobacterales bacterium]
MNRTLFTKLGFVRTALAVAVGIPLLAASAFAQATSPTPPADVPDSPVAAGTSAAQQDSTSAGGSAATAERIIV